MMSSPSASGGRSRRASAARPLVAAALLLGPLPALAQATDPGPGGPARESRPGLSAWERLGLGALALGALALLDEPTRDLAIDLQGGAGDEIASFGRWYGDYAETAPLLAGGFALVGVAAHGGRGARGAAAIALGVLSGSFANEALNRALGRSRPDEGAGPWRFEPFEGHASLGSGHAAYTFAIAAAVDEVTEGWVSVPFYAAAVVTGLSRIYHDRHWLSDVVVGGTIGLWVGRRATRSAARALGLRATDGDAEPPEGIAGVLSAVQPVVSPSTLGVRLAF